eukprot:4761297-Prymnesium_polylepis.1
MSVPPARSGRSLTALLRPVPPCGAARVQPCCTPPAPVGRTGRAQQARESCRAGGVRGAGGVRPEPNRNLLRAFPNPNDKPVHLTFRRRAQ